ncbi:hypothetical protein ABBQ38_007163 [Trebouxia sp. C0009 RCD-2024]
MQPVRSRKSSRDLSLEDVTASRKRAKTKDTTDMENGDVYTNGNGAAYDGLANPPEFLGSRGMVNRKEYIRLLEQALYSLGFRNAAKDLEVASGIDCEPAEVRAFRRAITEGSWDRAVKLLSDLDFPGELAQKKAKFLVLREKYLEALAKGNTTKAVKCLRMELAPLHIDTVQLHNLANAVMCQDEDDLQKVMNWAGPDKGSRQALLNSLQEVVSADMMIPEGRLQSLVEQALDRQLERCLYHNVRKPMVSLLSDYQCGREQIPSVVYQVLTEHTDEVWHVAFSHDGTMLASASKDKTAIIWQVQRHEQRLVKKVTLSGHSDPIAYLAWSPDDSMLATCGNDNSLRVWSSSTGDCVKEMTHHSKEVSSVAWLPDSKRLVTGSHDKYMMLTDIQGHVQRTWKASHVHDLAISQDGSLLFCVTSEKKVRIYNLESGTELTGLTIEEKCGITSIFISQDQRHLLLNLNQQRIHLHELGDPTTNSPSSSAGTGPVQKYVGSQEQKGRFVVRSCLGGINQAFVLSGSEDCKVHIWHRTSGDELACLEGHSGTVNSVSWNPVDHQMFVSASDDHTIHVWGPAAAQDS